MLTDQKAIGICGRALVVAAVALLSQSGGTQETKKIRYPEPRFPSYLLKPSQTIDDLMPQARAFVRIKEGGQGVGMGNVGPGDTLLLVPDVTAEELCLQAVKSALEERGIKVVIKSEAEMVGLTREDAETYRKLTMIPSAKQGYLEARNYWFDDTPRVWADPGIAKEFLRKRRPDIYNALYPENQKVPNEFRLKAARLSPTGVGTAIRKYLDSHPEITAVYWGKQGAGFSGLRAMGAQAGKRVGFTNFGNYYVLASQIPTFPSDVAHLIEKKTVEMITADVDKVHVTDPEGTDVTWDVSPEMADRWRTNLYLPNHLLMYPDTATGKYGFNVDTYPQANKVWVPRQPIARINGVIAGTNGSAGFFPRMEITFKDGYITQVKGGGMYGEVIRQFLTYPHINDITYPNYDQPGYWHLWEMALGTNPKYFRDPSDFYGGGHTGVYCLTFERYRTGVIHWGFGNELPNEDGSLGAPTKWLEFGKEHSLPTGHDFHIHNYFITYQVHRSSTNEWVTLIDRGHLVALDDLEVRKLAAQHGDPNKILNEDWIPSIPGINSPGRYEDYARDPWKYADAEMKKILNGTYKDYYPPITTRTNESVIER